MGMLHVNEKKTGVLVIDMSEKGSDGNLLSRQIAVLKFAEKFEWPVWLVDIEGGCPHLSLRKAALSSVCLFKSSFNAFETVGIKEAIATAGVRNLVIMGQQSDQ